MRPGITSKLFREGAGGGALAAGSVGASNAQTRTSPASSPRCDCGGPLKAARDETLVCVRCGRVYEEPGS